MNKAELIEAVLKSSKTEVTKADTVRIFDAIFEVAKKTVKKDKRFAIPNFGTFKVTKRKARKGRNPQTGEEIKIKASKSVNFKPVPTFKKSL